MGIFPDDRAVRHSVLHGLRDGLWRGFVHWQFFALRTNSQTEAYDFENIVCWCFFSGSSLARCFDRPEKRPTRDDGLHALWAAVRSVAVQFYDQDRLCHSENAEGATLGQFYVLYLVVVTKFADMGAYLVGSRIGRHHMMPHISPSKTWEGFVGSLVFAVAGSCS